MLDLATLAPDVYVREVLPYSRSLWAGARTFEEYVQEFRATAESGWGRRRFRTLGLCIDGTIVASCKRYERVLRCGEREYRAAGIGAVFTPDALRGRGYATALLGAFLDAERAAGTDLAYLFSDIGPAFYARLGFVALPSRTITLRADALPGERVAITTLGDADTSATRRLFTALEARRPFAFKRSPLDWEWQRLRAASREHGASPLTLGVRRGRSLAAYVTGRRVPAADAFVLDELAYANDEDARHVAPLLRAAAGDLRKVQGWLPPAPARDALPRGAVRARNGAIAMVLPLSSGFRAARRNLAESDAASDPCWSTDHI
ncbi:MAG TPA: GNAT family N-acetyltransferase [Candidatus Limnocylindria bacterium]|jgi:predicted N-acetyltransferase YhbS|nr:GNAT family N-acetyltransferase [Candidatus Limnocylindria bacterium]